MRAITHGISLHLLHPKKELNEALELSKICARAIFYHVPTIITFASQSHHSIFKGGREVGVASAHENMYCNLLTTEFTSLQSRDGEYSLFAGQAPLHKW